MYNVIIADDEPLVIQSLISGIDWKALNCNVINTFNNSKDAYDYVMSNRVDIIIADISMPPFSGLSLCSSILEHNQNIQFIIISGYADFSYAHKAMQIGVVGYCLKPIDYNEITLLIKKSCERLNPNKNEISVTFIESIYENDHEQVQKNLEQLGITENLYLMVSVGKSSASPFITIPHYTMKIATNRYLYLSSQNINTNIDRESLLNEHGILGIGGSGISIHRNRLKSEIEFATSLAYSFFLIRTEKIFVKASEERLSKLKDLSSSIKSPAKVKTLLQNFKISNIKNEISIREAIKIHNIIFEYYYDLQQDNEEDNYIYSYDQLIREYDNFESMLDSLCTILDEGFQQNVKDGEFNNRNFLDMMNYISENFTKDISIKSISDTLHLNSNYISQLFKKETGVTYSSYITTLRINLAKELLAQPENTVTQVGEQCGFNDYFYFIKTFKKYVGISPSDYRRTI